MFAAYPVKSEETPKLRVPRPVDQAVLTKRASLAHHNMVIKNDRISFLRRRQEFIRLNWNSIRRFVDTQCPNECDLSDQPKFQAMAEQPPFLHGVQMRDYQLKGLNWLISSYQNGINVILGGDRFNDVLYETIFKNINLLLLI